MDLSTGETMQYGVCLWSAGNSSREVTQQIFVGLEDQQPFAAPRPEMQKLAVDPYLRIIGAKNAFAAGDCARIVSAPLPPTAQVCLQPRAGCDHC
jgi:NADH:ubiquinone reductase (non-electrogenic)